jgi:predicted outer membrane repeat protein
MSRLSGVFRCLPLLLFLMSSKSVFAMVSVGPDTGKDGCEFHSIQEAIDHVLSIERLNPNSEWDPFIAVAGGVYPEALSIDGSGVSDADGALVSIAGGWDGQCQRTNSGTDTTIDTSSIRASVATIRGKTRMFFDSLTLSGGHATTHGGGIDFAGLGLLDIRNTIIANNSASVGGGIFANGSRPGLRISLHSGTTIFDNASDDGGGGMQLQGEIFLDAMDGQVAIVGNTTGGDGGGISFRGNGSVNFKGVQIGVNHGNNGGGLYVNSDGAATAVNFFDGVFVLSNKADGDGGGIYLTGGVQFVAKGPAIPTLIASNEVLDDAKSGGGIFVEGPANVTFAGTIRGNSAGNGGGMAILAGTDHGGDVTVRLAASNASAPIAISNNTATRAGGGIYSRGYGTGITNGDSVEFAVLRASDFVIDNNTAPEGTAIYGSAQGDLTSSNFGPLITLDSNNACFPNIPCNEIAGNSRSGGGAKDGSTIVIPKSSKLLARRIRIQGNQGAHVLSASGVDTSIFLDSVLMTDNQTDAELIDVDTQGITIVGSTIAHNAIGGQHVIRGKSDIILGTSIVSEQVTATLDFAGSNNVKKDIAFVLTNPLDQTMAAGQTILFGDPQFVDVANRDYHLSPESPAIDIAPAKSASPDVSSVDLDSVHRDQDMPWAFNVVGPGDLGAYEFFTRSDVIFIDGFGPD